MNLKTKFLASCLILACILVPVKSIEAATELELDAVQRLFVDTHYQTAIEVCTANGLPWEAVMAQGILESGSGRTKLARERNNLFGICAYDSDVNKAKYYETTEECWASYCRVITGSARYADAANNYATDPYGYVAAIKAAGYATDPEYVNKLSSIVARIEAYSLEMGYKSSAFLQLELENQRLREEMARQQHLELEEIVRRGEENPILQENTLYRSILHLYKGQELGFA